MSSGEWDLRALKALEEEEQREFLALSQKSLFDPPSPPAREKLLQQTQQLKQQLFQPKLTYAQLHPHILKLPTINECNLIAAARRRQLLLQQQNIPSSSEGGRRLKLTRALSISAHSLPGRGSGHREKIPSPKPNSNALQDNTSSSPPQSYGVSPVYTPPPIRRCAPLYHTQPVRKAFKTLQQLEKQKQDGKREAAATLKRVVGTNKTYWKYGANSTAASIIGQRKLNSSIVEIESNTSDEFGSEDIKNNISGNGSHTNSDHWLKSYVDCDDSATETGSCTVPLASDSVEMMRLMLSAATAAVTTHPIKAQTATAKAEYASNDVNYLLNEWPSNIMASADTVATGGVACKDSIKPLTISTPLSSTKLNGGNNVPQSGCGSTFLTLSSRYPLKLSASLFPPKEKTVAYKAFKEQQRRRSLSHKGVRVPPTLQRGRSLTDESSVNDCSSNSNIHSLTITGPTARNGSIRKMLKASSLDMSTNFDAGSNVECGSCNLLRPSLIRDSIDDSMTSTTSVPIKGLDVLSKSTIDVVGAINANGQFDKNSTQQQQRQDVHFHTNREEHPHISSMVGREFISPNNESNCNSSTHMAIVAARNQESATALSSLHQHVIDNELEQHIKHCSCSCNHMGYGNSMDYQVSFGIKRTL